MERIKKFIDASSNKQYYEHRFSKLSEEQKSELVDLVLRLDNAGAISPLSWAYSEVTEKIPQLGRFLVLKHLFEIAKSVDDNVSIAVDFDEKIEDNYSELQKIAGKERLHNFLAAYSKGIIYNLIGLLDEGNINADEDKISWLLMKTNEHFEPTEQIIQGLHEDFLEFENQLK